MNFKEQYKSAFSEIHASEETITRICEVTTMKGMNENKARAAKSKKIFISLLAAAVFAATSAVAVSAGALNDVVSNIRMYINGEEVSASDYISSDGDLVLETGDGESTVSYTFDDVSEDSEICISIDEINEETTYVAVENR